MRPRIGIDIDDVLSETALFTIKNLQERYNYTIGFEDIIHFDWPKISGFPMDMPTTVEFFRTTLGEKKFIDQIFPLHQAVESIQQLGEVFELHAITARHPSTSDATHAWIAKNFGDIFAGRIEFLWLMHDDVKMNKWDACILYELEAFVEDNIDYALTIVEKGIPCFLMERPWNKQRTETHELLVRVKSWEEARTGIQQLYRY